MVGRDFSLRKDSSSFSLPSLLRWACFFLAPAILYLGILTSARLGTTAGEILLGVLGSSAVAINLTILRLVVPRVSGRK